MLLIATTLPVAAQSHDDGSRIRQIVADQVAAWNIGDAKAFSLRFAKDGSFTNIRGTVFYGHRAFEDRHAEIFKTIFKGSKLAMTVSKIQFVRPDVAIVEISTELSGFQGMPPGVKSTTDGKLRTQLQEVLIKDKDEWRIASYHNVDVKEP
ncbi:MAG: SgcJ/EcaC family oxidoreductase [Candidatus Kryptoniota bacterium]